MMKINYTPRPPAGTRRTTRGFSLVELMVVVVILGTLAAISAPSIIRGIERNNARDEARAIANVFQRARSLATSNGQPVYVTVDADAKTITLTRPESDAITSCSMIVTASTDITDDDDDDDDDDAGEVNNGEVTVLTYTIGSRYPNAEFDHNLDATEELCFSPNGRLLKRGTNQPFVASTPAGCTGRNFMFWIHRPDSEASTTTNNCVTTTATIGQQKDAREMINFFMVHVPYTGNAEVLQ